MSFFKEFSLATDSNRAERAASVDRVRYVWFQGYLPPIPTLYNATLGDGSRGGLGSEPIPADLSKDLADYLLSPEQVEAMEAIVVEHGADGTSDAVIHQHPLFAAAEGETRGLLSSGGYDKQTGVPTPEVPSLVTYGLPRAVFNRSASGVTADLRKQNPPITTPADYSVIYNAYLKDSKEPWNKGGKVIGFDNLDQIYANDAIFGWNRLAGTNPRVLTLLTADGATALLKKMPLTDAHVAETAGPGATIAGEVAAKRLYVCDYWLLDGLPLQEGRYMFASIGVFWSNVAGQQLLPVAIQLGQTPGRVCTPADADWAVTKNHFAVSDFNYHEMGTHLSEAHFAQEAFIVATRRNLPEQHPIGALFGQIYWGLLYNNALGRLSLVNPGGYTDRMMAGNLANGSLQIVKDHYTKVWKWDDWNLSLYLAKKGTDDTTALPVYPYRDDGLPLWNAIYSFAQKYVDAWYLDAPNVAGDTELKSWVAELVDPAKGNMAVHGFPTSITTKAELTEVVARLVWQAGPGHGGINFPQWQFFGVVPNAPGAAYAVTGDIMSVLPPLTKAIDQVDILNIITQAVFGRIGQFDDSFMRQLNADAKNAVADFQSTLVSCGTAVNQRNSSGPRAALKYTFLHPDNLPSSTNI